MPSIQQIVLSIFSLLFPSLIFAQMDKHDFQPSEHIASGDEVVTFFAPDHGQKKYLFHLENGLEVTYGEIISLADFYQIPEEPVSKATSNEEGENRFQHAFDSIAKNNAAIDEAKKILAVIHEEQVTVSTAIEQGEEPDAVYTRIGNESNRQYNCITGGGCATSSWWLYPGRYLTIAKNNYDHFGAAAYYTYLIGHRLALKQALLAHATQNLKQLESAYLLNAFACHFLADRFASGHLRTPRYELSQYSLPASIGSVLASYMHNEENKSGLHVHNQRGDRWLAYGDGSYFSKKNEANRQLLQEALQLSANQIYLAYLTGTDENENEIIQLLPEPDEKNNASNQDIAPLFYWDETNKQLMRRQDISNVYDNHWTASWWGWSTLFLLKSDRGIPTFTQALLMVSTEAEKAIKEGLTTQLPPFILAQKHSDKK